MTSDNIIGSIFQSLRLKSGLLENRNWSRRFKIISCITTVALLLSLVINGCKKTEQGSYIPNVGSAGNIKGNLDCTDVNIIKVIEGILVKKGWTKTYESYAAGGSEYYVIGTTILRPSELVSLSDLEKYNGKNVLVKGFSVKGKPYTPSKDSVEQYPVNPDGTPEIIYVGAGFKVCEISVVRR